MNSAELETKNKGANLKEDATQKITGLYMEAADHLDTVTTLEENMTCIQQTLQSP